MSSAQATSSLAADAPRYGVAAADAYYALNQAGTGAVNVTQIVAGSNVTISPTQGTGVVTINAATQAPGVTAVNGETGNVQFQSTDGSVVITTPGTQTVNLAVPGSVITRGRPANNNTVPFGTAGVTIDLSGSNVIAGNVYQWTIIYSIGCSNTISPAVRNATSFASIRLENMQPVDSPLATYFPFNTVNLTPFVAATYVSGLPVATFAQYTASGVARAIATGICQLGVTLNNYDATTGTEVAANSMAMSNNLIELTLQPTLLT